MNDLAVDTETAMIEQGRLDPDLACVTYCDDTFFPGILHATEAHDFVQAALQTERIIGLNIAYDMGVLLRAYPDLKKLIFQAYRESRIIDCGLNQRLIDIANNTLDGYTNSRGIYIKHLYNLSALHERYGFGALNKSEDTWRKRYSELIPLPLQDWPEAATSYAKDDAAATLRVHRAQQQYSEFLDDSAAQARGAFALHLQSVRGMITDGRTCQEYIEETKLEILRCQKLCEAEGLIRGPEAKSKAGTRDMKKAKERMERVCAELGISPKLTDKKQICLDAEACRDSADPVLKAYSTYVSANTILTRAEALLHGSRGLPLQTSYNPLLNNGRTSSREPSFPLKGTNFQNVPREGRLRHCYIPRPGFLLDSIDYQMAELHTVSQCEIWFTGKSKLAEALNQKRDVHCDVGSILINRPYEEVLANRKTGIYKKARQDSKEVNFGGFGCLSPKRLTLQTNKKAKNKDERIDDERAKVIMRAWEARWEPQNYFDAVRALFPNGDGRGLATIKQFVSGRVRAHIDFPTACNTFFSGLAAEGMKAALFALAEACYTAKPSDALYGTHPVLSIHDENLLEHPIDRAVDAAWAACEIMINEFNRYVPDVHVRAKPALMEYWDKNAEDIYDETGLLAIWTPTGPKSLAPAPAPVTRSLLDRLMEARG